jgi:hypothetical protein
MDGLLILASSTNGVIQRSDENEADGGEYPGEGGARHSMEILAGSGLMGRSRAVAQCSKLTAIAGHGDVD